MAKVSAGRVLMLNKGSYDPEVTYVTLDYVSHNQKMWLCRKTALGVEPVVGSEFWDLMFDIDIADNLETDNANYALSARQGKVLGDKLGNEDISELGESVTEAINYLKEHSGSEAQKVICEDGETAQEKFDKGVYHATEGTQVDPLPRNADVLGGKYTAADIDELSSNLAKNHVQTTWKDILSYNSESKMYTAPTDGYLILNEWGGNTARAHLYTRPVSEGVGIITITAQNSTNSIFVRKGMKIYVTLTTTSSVQAYFTGIN